MKVARAIINTPTIAATDIPAMIPASFPLSLSLFDEPTYMITLIGTC